MLHISKDSIQNLRFSEFGHPIKQLTVKSDMLISEIIIS